MWANARAFMSIFRATKPVICKIHNSWICAGMGESDIALCADIKIMSNGARIGYIPSSVWGCPATAMWVYRSSPEMAKRMMFTGEKVSGSG